VLARPFVNSKQMFDLAYKQLYRLNPTQSLEEVKDAGYFPLLARFNLDEIFRMAKDEQFHLAALEEGTIDPAALALLHRSIDINSFMQFAHEIYGYIVHERVNGGGGFDTPEVRQAMHYLTDRHLSDEAKAAISKGIDWNLR